MSARTDVLLWANRVTARADTAAPHELLEIAADASLDDAQAAFYKIARLGHPDLHRGLEPDELENVTTAYAIIANAYQTFRVAKLRGGAAPAPLGPIAAGGKLDPRTKRPSEQAPTVRLPGGGVISGHAGSTLPPKNAPRGGKPPTEPPPSTSSTPATTSGALPTMARTVTATAASPPPPRGGAPAPRRAGDTRPPPSRPGTEPPAPTADAPTLTGTSAAQAMSPKALVYYRKAEIALRRGDLRGATLNLKLAIAADPHSQYLRQALGEVEAELKQT